MDIARARRRRLLLWVLMPEVTCDTQNLKAAGLSNYHKQAPGTMIYLARKVYRQLGDMLERPPTPEECEPALTTMISVLASLRIAAQAEMSRPVTQANLLSYARMVAGCVLVEYWSDIALEPKVR